MNAKDAWLKQVKHHKKRLKGLPRIGFNPNAGNVEHNISMMNKMLNVGEISNNPISGPFGGDVSASAGDGAGIAMGEAYRPLLNNLSPELKLFIEENIDYIEHNQFTDLYEMLTTDIAPVEELTDILLSADIDPLPYFERYLPLTYATGLEIEEVEIPGNIQMIQSYAFYDCEKLVKADIMYGVEYVGEEAFCNCYNLKEVNLPKSLLQISRAAFCECPNLKNVYYHGTMEQFSKVKLPVISSINKGSDFDCIQCVDGNYYLDPY